MTTIMVLDVDGVLNVFTRAYPHGHVPKWYADTHRYAPDMNKVVRPYPHGPKYAIKWSSDCIHDITGMMTRNDDRLLWLSSWSPFADTILNPMFGMDAMDNVEAASWFRGFHADNADKLSFMMDHVNEHTDDVIIWVDDEAVNVESHDAMAERFGDTVSMLMIQTNEEIGISRPQMDMIRGFTGHPKRGVWFNSEAHDYHPGVEHRGY